MRHHRMIPALLGAVAVALALSTVHASTAGAVPPIVSQYQAPDLMVSSATQTSVVVYNNSPAATGGFWVHLTSGSWRGVGPVGDVWRYIGLGGFQWTTLSFDPSTSDRVVQLDYYNTVRESNENNNTAWIPVYLW